jgi:hypothetical protein
MASIMGAILLYSPRGMIFIDKQVAMLLSCYSGK